MGWQWEEWHPQLQRNLLPLAGCMRREFRAFTPLPKGTKPAEVQNHHKSKAKVSFPHRLQPWHWESLSEGSRSHCPQPIAMGGSDREPPSPAMPCGGSMAPPEPVTLLLTVGVGRMLLKCLFLLRRAILYCRERGMVAAPAWTSWLCQEPARASQALSSDGCNPSITPRFPGLLPLILSYLQNYPQCRTGYFPIQNHALHWIPDPKAATAGQGTSSQAATRTHSRCQQHSLAD